MTDWETFRPRVSAVAADIEAERKKVENALLAAGIGEYSPWVAKYVRSYGPAKAIAVGYFGLGTEDLYDVQINLLTPAEADSQLPNLPEGTAVTRRTILPVVVNPSGPGPITLRVAWGQQPVSATVYADVVVEVDGEGILPNV